MNYINNPINAFYGIVFPLKMKIIKIPFYILISSICVLFSSFIFNVRQISKNELVRLTLTDAAYFIDYCGSCDLYDYYTCWLFRFKIKSSECTIHPNNQFMFDDFKTRKKVEFNPFTDYFMTK